MEKIGKEAFIERLKKLKLPISGKRGQTYSSFKIEMNFISFQRDSSNTPWHISIDQLYDAYKYLNFIDTPSLKKFVDRKQSPSWAILVAINLYNRDGTINLISHSIKKVYH